MMKRKLMTIMIAVVLLLIFILLHAILKDSGLWYHFAIFDVCILSEFINYAIFTRKKGATYVY